MTDIPEDIMRSAREAVCLHYRHGGLRADAPWLESIRGGGCDETPEVSSAALAILAERQAYEKIARDRAEKLGNEFESSSPQDVSLFHQLKEAVNMAHLIAARSS